MLIPIFRVIASQFPVDTLTGNVEMGMAVGLVENSAGNVVIRKSDDNAAANTAQNVVGIAGDRKRASEAYEWTNRVSDMGDDTSASGLMTVYHGGGEFWFDVDDGNITTPLNESTIRGPISSAATITVGGYLYVADSSQSNEESGQFHNSESTAIVRSGEGVPVLQVVSKASSIESGIPGEYEPGSSVNYPDPSVPRTWVRARVLV